MPYAQKVVLHTPRGVPSELEAFVHEFMATGGKFIAAVGRDCSLVEDIIDEIAVESGSPERNFILTSSHEGETLQEVVNFAESLTGEYEGAVQVVEL